MKKARKLLLVLKKQIISMIHEDWSPQRIEGRLKFENQLVVSHETICKIIRKDKQGGGGSLYKHTRHQLKHRKRPIGAKIPIENRASIDERPEKGIN